MIMKSNSRLTVVTAPAEPGERGDNGPDPLFGVEFRHLAALLAIAQTSSFSKAGERLGYAQSAISQQLAALERAVGHKLVERPGGPRPVSLTEAGEMLLRHAETITDRLRAAKADLDALATGEAGTLRIGAFQSVGARILPAVLARFREHWPNIGVSLVGQSVIESDLGAMVRRGQLDLAFIVTSDVEPPLTSVELLVDPYVVLFPAESPFASRTQVELSELCDLDLISGTLDDPCTARLHRAFEALDRQPNIVFRTDDNLTVQRLVGVGLGGAVVANLTVEAQIGGPPVVQVPLGPNSHLERRIGLVWHSGRHQSRAATAFVEEARVVCEELALGNAL